MKILLVEDEYPKRQNILNFLKGLKLDLEISFANSANSALDSIDIEIPDLMILDMSLPTFDINDHDNGGTPRGFGGEDVLRILLIDSDNVLIPNVSIRSSKILIFSSDLFRSRRLPLESKICNSLIIPV